MIKAGLMTKIDLKWKGLSNKYTEAEYSGRVAREIKGQEKSGGKNWFLLFAAFRDRRPWLHEDGHTGAGVVQYQKSGKGCDPSNIRCDWLRQKVTADQTAAYDCTEAGVRGNWTGKADDDLPADFLGVQSSGCADSAHQKYNWGGFKPPQCTEHL